MPTRTILLSSLLATTALAAPPTAKKAPVTDEFHGVKVSEDYRWLEDASSSDVKAWSDAQNAHARTILDSIACRSALRARIAELEGSVGVEYHALKPAAGNPGVILASKNQPPKQQPLIVALSSLDDLKSERVILDVNALDPSGHTAFDWFVPSPDGKLVAVSLSQGGSESGDVHVYDVATGKERPGDTVPRVNGGTAGGSLAWIPDASGFFYTRYPRAGERDASDMDYFTQVYFHALGTPTADDRYETGKDYPKIAEIMLEVSPDGKWALANVQNGDGGEFIQDVRPLAATPDKSDKSAKPAWTRLSRWEDRVVEAKFGFDSALYLVSRKGAPNGQVLRLPLTADKAPALPDSRLVVPEQSDNSVQTDFSSRSGLTLTPSRIYVLYQAGGPNALAAFDLAGNALGTVPQPEVSTIENVEHAGGPTDDLVFQIDSFVRPPACFRLTASAKDAKAAGAVKPTAISVPEPPKAPRLAVRREFATSKDGTKVPVNIITAEGVKPDAKVPTIVWGYGGYGVNETPGYSRRRLAWLEQGCAFVLANIRGGGEYGEKWHTGGNLLNKQNVFDDFYAACKYCIDSGLTDGDHLAIMGGSNGGLLMGATITQHPDLCKACVSSVGIYDMLRVELSPNGAFNVTEFGTVKDPAQFKALYAYSPYHHVADGTRYPATLFMTGANDPRVDPMQSRKFVARLQAADPAGTYLLRTSGNTGHGMGTPLSERIDQTADTYAFLMDQLGVRYAPPK